MGAIWDAISGKKAKKNAQLTANATLQASTQQANAIAAQAAEQRAAAEAQAQATRDAAAQQYAAAELTANATREATVQAEAASKRQEEYMLSAATAQKDANDKMAADARESARGAQQAREGTIAREVALSTAQDLMEQSDNDQPVDVTLASTTDAAEVDPETGRRRPARAAFMSKSSGLASITL